ncbi:PqqD family protein [Acidobacteria bacterium AH-259-A15]|nr:PqqD family protein [Acidobacteria bacterium AH-259-A15]
MAVDRRFLGCRPRRRLDWEEDGEGRAVLLRPKLGEGRLGRWVASYFKNPYYQIRFDEFGSLVWKSCDGKTQVSEILEQMRERFGDRIEPAEERLYEFICKMHRAKLIEF